MQNWMKRQEVLSPWTIAVIMLEFELKLNLSINAIGE